MFTNERLFTIQAFTITRVHCTWTVSTMYICVLTLNVLNKRIALHKGTILTLWFQFVFGPLNILAQGLTTSSDCFENLTFHKEMIERKSAVYVTTGFLKMIFHFFEESSIHVFTL